jgi:hypothetical protein
MTTKRKKEDRLFFAWEVDYLVSKIKKVYPSKSESEIGPLSHLVAEKYLLPGRGISLFVAL